MKFYTLLLIIFYGFNNNFKSNTIHIFKKSLNRTSRVKIFYKWINKTDEQKIKESWLKKDINKKLTYLDFLDSSFYLKTFFLMFINSYFLIYIMFNKEVKNLMKNLCNRLGYLILNNINIKDDSDAKNIITEVIDSIYIIIIIYIIEKIAQFFFIINLKKIKKFSKKK